MSRPHEGQQRRITPFTLPAGWLYVAHGLYCKDTKLHLSSYYLDPDFASGQSHLLKDLRAIVSHASRGAEA
jgi:hypothetical protein